MLFFVRPAAGLPERRSIGELRMGGFKRFCMFVFSLSGLLCLAAFVLTWLGPWTAQASALFSLPEYYTTVEVLLLITVAGLLIMLFRSVFSRRVRTVEVTTVDGGTISVSRDAIASQAKHTVEADGTCSADRVFVSAKKRGHVRVHVRVLPHESVDVVEKGTELHEELVRGLTAVCGDKLEDVSLEFVEPKETADAPAAGDVSVPTSSSSPASTTDYSTDSYQLEATEPSYEDAPSPAPQTASYGAITVPMGAGHDGTSSSAESDEDHDQSGEA